MAMRDPGTPGRNPFFDHGPDAELGDLAPEPDELDEDPFAAFPFLDGPDPFATGAAPGPTAAGIDPLGTLAALVDALQGAQPDATDHLVAAAHELVLAVKSVVDATEAVLAAQRAAVGAATSASNDGASDDAANETPPDPFSSDRPSEPRTSGVRRIDLA